MPTYSYKCSGCNKKFELYSSIKNYVENPNCINCDSSDTYRLYIEDVCTQSSSVKKSDSELKTIGDLAMRNTERMSTDEKISLYKKHNSYKETQDDAKPLPKGMSRMKKPPKTIWPS